MVEPFRATRIAPVVSLLIMQLALAAPAQAAAGQLDSSFGGDGKVITPFGNRSQAQAYSEAIQADGKIVAAGDTFQRGSDRFALARYNPSGSLDSSFGGDGKVATHFASMSDDNADSVAIQADGKVVAGGETFQSHDRFALAR